MPWHQAANGNQTLRTQDTSALIWCRSVQKTVWTSVPNCLTPWTKVSHPLVRSALPYYWAKFTVPLFKMAVHKERTVSTVLYCRLNELSRHFSTSAKIFRCQSVSGPKCPDSSALMLICPLDTSIRHFDTSAPVPNCLDAGVLGPKCLSA